MHLRLVLFSTVFLALAANQPCFAKESHAQHAHAGAAGKGAADKSASGKGVSGAGAGKGANTANPAETKSNLEAIPPPVLSRGDAKHANRKANLKLKIVPPENRLHNVPAASVTAPARNAIGQTVSQPKNLAAAPPVPALQGRGVVAPPIIRGRPAEPPVSSAVVPANIAKGTNRGKVNGAVNGATAIRPATGPSGIGGPAQAHYGINGTTVQNRH